MKRTGLVRRAVTVGALLLLAACGGPAAVDGAGDDATRDSTMTPAQAQVEAFDGRAFTGFKEVGNELQGIDWPTNEVPDRFNRQLRRMFRGALRQQPLLGGYEFYLAEWSQLVSLEDVAQETPRTVGLFIFAVPTAAEYGTDWVLRLVVDVDTWELLDWGVNENVVGGFKSGNNYLASTSDETVYRRRVNTNSDPFELDGSVLYLADVGTTYQNTVLYGDDDYVYRINRDYSLTRTGVW